MWSGDGKELEKYREIFFFFGLFFLFFSFSCDRLSIYIHKL